MATIQAINLGAAPNDDTGEDLRSGGSKINSNFTAVNTELVSTTALAGTNATAIAGLGALSTLDTVGTGQIDNDAVTLAKIQDITTARLLGRTTAGAGIVEELTAAAVRTFLNVEDGAAADQTAAQVAFTPVTGIVATDVQAAVEEVRADALAADISLPIAISDVTNLQTSLDGKANTSHTHTLADVTDSGALAALNSVAAGQIDSNAVTTAKIADANVTGAKLATNSVNTANIADNAVTTAKIGANQVTTAKIPDNAITTGKIADDAVTTGKIADNAVQTADIQDDAVTAAKIATALDQRTGASETIANADHRETLWLTNAGTVTLSFQVDIAEGTEVTVVNISGGAASFTAGGHTLIGDTSIPQNQAASVLVGTTVSGSNRNIFIAASA